MKTGALLSGTDPRAIKVIMATSIGDRFHDRDKGGENRCVSNYFSQHVRVKVRTQLYLNSIKKYY